MLPATTPVLPRSSFPFGRQHVPLQPLQPFPQSSPTQDQSAQIQPPQAKKRKTDRACDACRRKKTRCDGPWSVNNICTNCIQTKKPCTYLEASKPRGPPKAYVTGLEDRVAELEALLAQIRPHADFSDELGPPVVRDSWKHQGNWSARQTKPRPSKSASASRSNSPSHTAADSPPSSTSAAPSLAPLVISPNPAKDGVIPENTPKSSRTTHLMFKSRLKKQKSRAGSDYTVSSGSGSSTAMTTNPGFHSASPYASTSDSEYSYSEEESDSDSEYTLETSLSGRNRIGLQMAETPQAPDNRILFHGRSSTASLVEATRMFKHMHLQEAMQMEVSTDSRGHSVAKSEESESKGKDLKAKVQGPDNYRVSMTRRPTFWQTPAWEAKYQLISNAASPQSVEAIPRYLAKFPPPDLCRTLIKLYFFHSNNFFPLLHQPTFERQWEERVYERNIWHTCLCLGVFAVASRWCNDERVLHDICSEHPWRAAMGGTESMPSDGTDWNGAGWKYFEASADIHKNARALFYPSTLFEVQSFVLTGMFLRGTQHIPIAWMAISIGLRKAQDVGAHRRTVYRSEPNAEDELWKRAFWHLVVFDRLGGSALGRSVGISEEDFDLPLPLEVDDEYWTGPNAWKQPTGTPSIVTSFVHFIKLTQIIAFTSKSVYAIDKTKVFRGFIQGDWRVEVVSQLNTAMEEWLNNMPAHLVWSEAADRDPVFFAQSAALYSTYHLTTMLIYRPFIPAPPLLPTSLHLGQREASPPPPFPFPALALCISACRACTRIIEVQLHRRSIECVLVQGFINAAFTCAGTLILALWDLKAQQRVLIKVKHAGVMDYDKEHSMETGETHDGIPEEEAKTDALLLSLKRKMDELVLDLKILVEALEWMKDRWEFAQSMLSRLKESMPSEQDLREDFGLSGLSQSKTHRTGIVKHMSFQDMRRQRQREQQMEQEKKLHRKLSQPLDSDIKPIIDLPTLPASWNKDIGYSGNGTRHTSSGLSLSGSGSHSPISLGGRNTQPPIDSLQPPSADVDVNRFLQDYPQLHTFTDDDFDEPHETTIQLPSVSYPAPTKDRNRSEVHSPHHPSSGCHCPDCVPVSHNLGRRTSSHRLRQNDYPPSRPDPGEEIHLRPVPQSVFPMESQTQYLHRDSTGSIPLNELPSRRPSLDNFGRRTSHTVLVSPHTTLPLLPQSRSSSSLDDHFVNTPQHSGLPPIDRRDSHHRQTELADMGNRYRYSGSSPSGLHPHPQHTLAYPISSEDSWKYSSGGQPFGGPFSGNGNFNREWEHQHMSNIPPRASIPTAYPQNSQRLSYQGYSDGSPHHTSFGG